MAAESSRAATRDRGQHLLMLTADPSAATFDDALSGVTNDVSHLHRRPAQTDVFHRRHREASFSATQPNPSPLPPTSHTRPRLPHSGFVQIACWK